MEEPLSDRYGRIATLMRKLAQAQKRSEQAMERRRNLSPGGTRARVTTANANWAKAAEQRDRLREQLEKEGVEVPRV